MRRLVVFGSWALSFSLLSLGSAAQQRTGGSVITVVQMSYYAQLGKEKEVLENRMQACAVLERNGISRGRVMSHVSSSRETRNADNPDVVWEGEFPDVASLTRYEDLADTNAEFLAVRQKMGTLTRKTERRYFEIR
jgi:hypothetical protein